MGMHTLASSRGPKVHTRLAVRTRLGRLGWTAMSLIASPCPSAACIGSD